MNSYNIKIVQVEYNNSSLKKYQKPKYEWNLHQEILVNVLVYSQHFFFMQLKRSHKFWKQMNIHKLWTFFRTVTVELYKTWTILEHHLSFSSHTLTL